MQHLYEALGKAILRPDHVMMSGLFVAHVCTCMYLFVCLQNSLVSKVRFFDALLLVAVTSIDCYSNRFFVPSFFFSLSLFLARLPFLFLLLLLSIFFSSTYLLPACLTNTRREIRLSSVVGTLQLERRTRSLPSAAFTVIFEYVYMCVCVCLLQCCSSGFSSVLFLRTFLRTSFCIFVSWSIAPAYSLLLSSSLFFSIFIACVCFFLLAPKQPLGDFFFLWS